MRLTRRRRTRTCRRRCCPPALWSSPGRPADEEHPFGYGSERFFWAFLAATLILVAGAVVVHALCGHIEEEVRRAVPDVSQFFIDPTSSEGATWGLGAERRLAES